jgi:hypothetical protein
MTTQAVAAPHAPDAATDDARSRRLLGLSGITFVPLFLIGWFASNGLTPDYTAADQKWVNWAHEPGAGAHQWVRDAVRGIRVPLLHVRHSSLARECRVSLVTMAAASSDGANVDPTVAKSVTTGAAGPFMVAAMGFAAFLLAAGLVTLRTGVFARWTGIIAIIGGVSYLVTFLVVLDGTTDGSPFGYGFFPGALALVTWTAAASVSTYRSTAT